MYDLFELMKDYSLEILIVAILVSLISFIIVCINFSRTTKIIRKYKRLMRGVDNKNLEAMLYKHLDSVQEGLTRLKNTELKLDEVTRQIEGCFQKSAVVRFNAFEKMGGEQSYSIALLNTHGNGFVLTGLYGRNSSTTFAKPISNFHSEYPLSNEELEAIKRAADK